MLHFAWINKLVTISSEQVVDKVQNIAWGLFVFKTNVKSEKGKTIESASSTGFSLSSIKTQKRGIT